MLWLVNIIHVGLEIIANGLGSDFSRGILVNWFHWPPASVQLAANVSCPLPKQPAMPRGNIPSI